MQDTDHCILVAEARAVSPGERDRLCAAAELTVPREIERFRKLQEVPDYHLSDEFTPDPMDTVGAVAIDQAGDIAAAIHRRCAFQTAGPGGTRRWWSVPTPTT